MFRKIVILTGNLLLIGLLTLFTQVGGLVWLLLLPVVYRIQRMELPGWQRFLLKAGSFVVVYLLVSVLVVPPLAKWQCGRVPLPVFGHPNLKPHQVLYFAGLNHHYVRPEVRASMLRVAEALAKQHPGTVTYYLDANFPFFDGYPLQPHFSHRNGTTVDVALHWLHKGTPLDGAPTSLAYGSSALPRPGEVDKEQECNNWMRSFEYRTARRFYEEADYALDEDRTRALLQLFAKEKSVRKMLLEPHLKTRLGLSREDKIRFQGCRAARHDDHVHVIW